MLVRGVRGATTIEANTVEAVLEATREFRYDLARQLRARALEAQTRGGREWFLARADGAEERGYRIEHCGEKTIQPYCRGCGAAQHATLQECGHGLLCHPCRDRRIKRLRARLDVANRAAADRAKEQGFKARFITLTVPLSGSIKDDIATLPRAWGYLLREVQRRWGKLDFVRIIEWTPGSAGDGHAHIHALIFAPYMGQEWVAHVWGRALARLGRDGGSEADREALRRLRDAAGPAGLAIAIPAMAAALAGR